MFLTNKVLKIRFLFFHINNFYTKCLKGENARCGQISFFGHTAPAAKGKRPDIKERANMETRLLKSTFRTGLVNE